MTQGGAAPLVAVDRVLAVSESSISTLKVISGNEEFFRGHYPHFPIYPGVFIIEAVHQAARLFVEQGLRSTRHARLAEIQSVRLLAPLRPGDALRVDADCAPAEDPAEVRVKARCFRQGEPPVSVAQLKLRYALEP